MNTRRKMFSGLVLAAAALLTLSGCKKDEEDEKIMLGTQLEKVVSAQKTYLDDENTVCWNEGDKVNVNGYTYPVSVKGVAVTERKNSGYVAVYPATDGNRNVTKDGGSVVIPAEQDYTLTSGGQQIMRSPMAARLDAASGRLYFKNLHSIIRVDVTTGDEAFVLESITITSSTANLAGKLGFTFKTGGTTADAASAPELGSLTDAKKSVTLNFSEPITLGANTEARAFYLCVAPFTSTNLEIKVTGTPQGGTYAGKKGSYVFSRENKHLDRSIMAEVKADFGNDAAFEPESDPEPFKFSVSADLQVEFSPGNLQYQASSSTWRFAEHQWDYVGDATNGTVYAGSVKCDNASIASDYTGWIDLFGWGTSGWYNGNTFYQPYNCSNATTDPYTSSNGYGYGPTDGTSYTFDLTGTYENSDWGVYNAIYNPKTKSTDAAGTWRTLTDAEWAYLLGTSGRTRGGEHMDWWIYNMVTIEKADGTNDVMGLIIYPDGVTAKPDGLSVTLTKNGTDAVVIAKADFEKLEALGCVFLPAAGYRRGASVFDAGSGGLYWSSTYSYSSYAYYLDFDSGSVYPSDSLDRYRGHSVRLVKNVK